MILNVNCMFRKQIQVGEFGEHVALQVSERKIRASRQTGGYEADMQMYSMLPFAINQQRTKSSD